MTPAAIRARQDRLLLASHRLIARSRRLQDRLDARPGPDLADAAAVRQRADYVQRQLLIRAHMAALVGIIRRGGAVLH